MLDRILYRLASPLAREIIDSLRTEPGAWAAIRKPETSALWWLYNKGFQLACPKSLFWGRVSDGTTYYTLTRSSRFAIRRAIKAWEKNDG